MLIKMKVQDFGSGIQLRCKAMFLVLCKIIFKYLKLLIAQMCDQIFFFFMRDIEMSPLNTVAVQ